MSDKPRQGAPNNAAKTGVVPTIITIGLGVFALLLSTAGYVFRLLFGDDTRTVLLHAAKVVPFFMLILPALFCLGAYGLNRFKDEKVAWQNAWTLGWLTSCVCLLHIMGVYS